MTRRALLACSAILLAAPFCPAQEAKPNFSGKWVLAVDKSDFGAFPGPSSRTDVIDHQEPKLKITVTTKGQQGERTYERNYTTDGKENTNSQGPMEVKSKTRWDGKLLITEAKFEIQGNPVEIKEQWELTDEGKTLVSKRDLKSSQGETTQKLVFNKE